MKPCRTALIMGIAILVAGLMLPEQTALATEPVGKKETGSFNQVPYEIPDLEIGSTLQNLKREADGDKSRGLRDIAIFENFADAVVLLKANQSLGSGAIIHCAQGFCLAITNWHVVEGLEKIEVYFRPRRVGEAKVNEGAPGVIVAHDAIRDLAVVWFQSPPGREIPVFKLGTLDTVKIGEDVSAIGHPFGLTWSYAKGIISNVSRQKWSEFQDNFEHQAMVIQTQTPINPGNSGGPLINEQGELIGLNTYTFTGKAVQNLSFAVAVNEVKDLYETVLKNLPKLEAALSHRPPQKRIQEMDCTQNYSHDANYQIIGCLLGVSTPPPNAWLVTRGEKPIYVAIAQRDKGKVDVVSFPKEGEGKIWYVDSNCDGEVDFIRDEDSKGRYRDSQVPQPTLLTLVSLTPQLDEAIKKKNIPFPMDICR